MNTKTYAADDYAEIGRRMRELSEQQTKSVVNKPYECRVCSNSGWLGNSECDICGNPMGLAQPGNESADMYGDFYAGWQYTGYADPTLSPMLLWHTCDTCTGSGQIDESLGGEHFHGLTNCPDCDGEGVLVCR